MMAGWTMGTEAWIWMAVWALVLVFVVWLLVREPRHGDRDDPTAILRARFARGEITEEELRRALAALSDRPEASRWSDASTAPPATPSPTPEARHD